MTLHIPPRVGLWTTRKTYRLPRAPRHPSVIAGTATAGLAALAGATLAGFGPWPIFGVALAALIAFATTRPLGRLAMLSFGALFVFQTSYSTPLTQGAYLAAIAVCCAFAIPSLRSHVSGAANKSIWIGATILAAAVLLGIASGLLRGYEPAFVLRDSTAYVLLLAAPIIGVDAGRRLSAKPIIALAIVVSTIASLAYLATWLDNRGYSVLGLAPFGLSSSVLAIPIIAIGGALGMARIPHSRGAIIAASGCTALLLLAGGRSALVYLAAMFVYLFFLASTGRSNTRLRRMAILIITIAALVPLVLGLASALHLTDFLVHRYSWFSDASLSAVQSDESGQARLAAYRITFATWQDNFFLGTGFGHVYPAVSKSTHGLDLYTLDTPILALSKFGILGVGSLVAGVLTPVIALARAADRDNLSPRLALVATMVAWLAILPSGLPTEQKGFAPAYSLLLAFSLACVARPEQQRKGRPDNATTLGS